MGLNSVSLKLVSTLSIAASRPSTVVAALIALMAATSLFDFGFCPKSETANVKAVPATSRRWDRILMNAPKLKLSLKRLRKSLLSRFTHRGRRAVDCEDGAIVLLGFITLAGGVGQPAQI